MISKIFMLSLALLASSFYHSELKADVDSFEAQMQKPTYLILNMDDDPVLPRNFRTSATIVSDDSDRDSLWDGLADLNMSGSGQFSKQSLQKVYETLPSNNITVVDLRAEPHAVLNGMAITWYSKNNWTNDGLTDDEIDEDLTTRILQLMEESEISIYKSKHRQGELSVLLDDLETEEEVAGRLGLGYVRIYARDHSRPSDEAVDKFIEYAKSLDRDTWLHFHCSAGRGRTTTFMALYDMMKNADHVSVESIVERQKLIGGLDLFAMPSEDDWKYPLTQARAQLVKEFHRYCLENPDFSISWSDWVNQPQPNR